MTKRPKLMLTVKKNTNKLNKIASIVDTTTGHHLLRREFNTIVGSVFGHNGVSSFTGNNLGLTQNALTNLQYYNPASPAALTTADGDLGSYQREFLFEKVHDRITIQNQGYVAKTCRIYLCEPRSDTSVRPEVAWENGLKDQQIGNNPGGDVPEQPLSRPTDVAQFNDLWKTSKYEEFRLPVGGLKSFSHTAPAYKFDPSLADVHIMAYQARWKSFIWLLVLVGDTVQDKTETWVNNSNTANLVVSHVQTTSISYDAGTSVNSVEYQHATSDSGATAFNSSRPQVNRIDATGEVQTF